MCKNQIHIISGAWILAFFDGIYLKIIAWKLMKVSHEGVAWKEWFGQDASFISDPMWTQLYSIFQGSLLK